MNGLSVINIELTSKCNKSCWMCGRRKIERDYPELKLAYGNMDFSLVKKIANQLPPGIIVQFHNNGEPLLYPKFGKAVALFRNQIKCVDTNGKLLYGKQDEIINNLDTITVSTFEDDEKWEEQYYNILEFLHAKGNKKPRVIIRCLGDIGAKRRKLYTETGCLIADRILHSPMGSFGYKKKTIIPEHGICLEMLMHPAINIKGDVSICVRFDPERKGVLGNINDNTLEEIWNSEKRKEWLQKHIEGNRDVVPLCKKCTFWGIPCG